MNPPKMIIATTNAHKVAEIRAIAALLGWKVDLKSLSDFPGAPRIEEDGKTYEDNARIKAEKTMQRFGLPALGEDSGLEVQALGRAPGLLSARFMDKVAKAAGCSGSKCEQGAANREIIKQLGGKTEKERSAKYVSAACIAFPDGKIFCAKGECSGRIADKERGTAGFGFDPIFLPAEYDFENTFGELGQKAKDSISHRRRALEGLVAKLEKA